MNRFIYLADTHMGTDSLGYYQQPAYPARMAEIFSALGRWIEENGPIDFILHGGDMADTGESTAIQIATKLLRQLPVPVYCCLGNHDLTRPESCREWLSLYPEAFPGGEPEYVVEAEHCAIHVMPNHWTSVPYFWERGGEAAWLPGQWEALEARYRPRSGQAQILLTHSPVYGLPTGQTGLAEPFHPSPECLAQPLRSWVDRHPEIVAVLGAHSHMNMRVEQNGVQYVTASSFCEAPFEFKLFEADSGCLRMTTHSLGERVGFDGGYDASRAFVQGREEDRAFSLEV